MITVYMNIQHIFINKNDFGFKNYKSLGSVEMLNYKLNAHGGFTPATVAPPNTINPEQVIRHYR